MAVTRPPSSEVSSLRATIMPEAYAVCAEHQRRVNDAEDQSLDDSGVTLLECIMVLAMHSSDLITCIGEGQLPKDMVHRVAITLATDAAEVARRVRPK